MVSALLKLASPFMRFEVRMAVTRRVPRSLLEPYRILAKPAWGLSGCYVAGKKRGQWATCSHFWWAVGGGVEPRS